MNILITVAEADAPNEITREYKVLEEGNDWQAVIVSMIHTLKESNEPMK